jgi:hypothetical protein
MFNPAEQHAEDPMKQMKTAQLGIVLQVTEIHADHKGDRLWEVHDVERNRGFRVTLTAAALEQASAKKAPAEADLQGGIGLAIERFLKASPELVAGPLYDVQVSAKDLQDFAKLKA